MIISDNLKKLSKIFHKASPLYIVGGYVRDFLLSKHTNDVDICSSLTTLEVVDLLKNTQFTTNIVNEKLGTIIISIDNEKYEYTPFRKDNYTLDGSHSPNNIVFNVDIKEDYLRRDFTVNGLYYDIQNDKIIDMDKSLSDLENKLICTIREPEITFTEDALRLFRMIRQAVVLSFNIEENTLFTGRKCSKLIKMLSKERIIEEFEKTIEKVDFDGMLDYVELLNNSSIISSLYDEKIKIGSYKVVDGLAVYNPTIEFLYLAIFERYFYNTLDFVNGFKVDSFDSIVVVKRKIYDRIDKIFANDKLPNKVRKNIYELISFTRLLVEVKNEMQLDILLTHYYNIIITLLLEKQSKIMVRNTIIIDTVSRFITLKDTKPMLVKELKITGSDLQKLGVKKEETSVVLQKLLENVILDKVNNDYDSLVDFVKEDRWKILL